MENYSSHDQSINQSINQRSLSFSTVGVATDASRTFTGAATEASRTFSAQSSVMKHRLPPKQSINQSINQSDALLLTIQSSLSAQSEDCLAEVEALQRSVETKERARRVKTDSDRVKRYSILTEERASSLIIADHINKHFTDIQIKTETHSNHN